MPLANAAYVTLFLGDMDLTPTGDLSTGGDISPCSCLGDKSFGEMVGDEMWGFSVLMVSWSNKLSLVEMAGLPSLLCDEDDLRFSFFSFFLCFFSFLIFSTSSESRPELCL